MDFYAPWSGCINIARSCLRMGCFDWQPLLRCNSVYFDCTLDLVFFRLQCQELEISKLMAERYLKEHQGNVFETLVALCK